MTSYVYSSKTNSFYALELRDEYAKAKSWPEDAVEVEDSIYEEFSQHDDSQQRVAGKDGKPTWNKKTGLSAAPLKAAKDIAISMASKKISILSNVIEMGLADDNDVKNLRDWQMYQALVYKFNPEKGYADFPKAPE